MVCTMESKTDNPMPVMEVTKESLRPSKSAGTLPVILDDSKLYSPHPNADECSQQADADNRRLKIHLGAASSVAYGIRQRQHEHDKQKSPS